MIDVQRRDRGVGVAKGFRDDVLRSYGHIPHAASRMIKSATLTSPFSSKSAGWPGLSPHAPSRIMKSGVHLAILPFGSLESANEHPVAGQNVKVGEAGSCARRQIDQADLSAGGDVLSLKHA